MPDPNLPATFNKQCAECNQIINGPYEGQNPGRMVRHVRGEPDAPEFFEKNDEEHPLNISHGYCEDCAPLWMERMREQQRQMHAEKPRKTRFRRGRKDEQR